MRVGDSGNLESFRLPSASRITSRGSETLAWWWSKPAPWGWGDAPVYRLLPWCVDASHQSGRCATEIVGRRVVWLLLNI